MSRQSLLLVLATGVLALAAFASPLPQLKVSNNHRYLVTAEQQPFFWLGDTAWELSHRLNREDAERYLERRAQQGFTVIQLAVFNLSWLLNGRELPDLLDK